MRPPWKIDGFFWDVVRQSRKDHRARTDHHERSPETVGQKRRPCKRHGTGTRKRTAFSIITWNVDSLRALFVNDDGESLHNILTSRKPVLLCLLEHKLQDSHHEDSNRVRAQLEGARRLAWLRRDVDVFTARRTRRPRHVGAPRCRDDCHTTDGAKAITTRRVRGGAASALR